MSKHDRAADQIKIRGEMSPITMKRPYVSNSIGTSTPASSLPRSNKKWKPRPGSKRFGNGPKQAKPDQAWKFWDATNGKYIYASTKGGKGWVKA